MTPNQQQAIKRAADRIFLFTTDLDTDEIAAIITAELAAVPSERDAGLEALRRIAAYRSGGVIPDGESPQRDRHEMIHIARDALREMNAARITAGSKEEK